MINYLPDSLLEAFVAVMEAGSVSSAARILHVTQPALTVRLQRLEQALGVTLFTRSRKGVTLTHDGTRLANYAQARTLLDTELFQNPKQKGAEELRGIVRIAGHFSAIHHSVLPCVARLLRNNSDFHVQLIVREDDEIPLLLQANGCELALLQKPIGNPTYLCQQIGWERYVLAEHKSARSRRDTFIGTDPTDDFSDQFFNLQEEGKREIPNKRSFMYNENGILRGVELGLGRSVVYEPLVKTSSQARVAKGYRPLDIPIFLQCSTMSFYVDTVRRVFEYLVAHSAQHFMQKNERGAVIRRATLRSK